MEALFGILIDGVKAVMAAWSQAGAEARAVIEQRARDGVAVMLGDKNVEAAVHKDYTDDTQAIIDAEKAKQTAMVPPAVVEPSKV